MAVVEPGMRFGYLSVLEKQRVGRVTYWMVRCDCGTTKRVQQAQLHGAKRPISSCGCKHRELVRAARLRHGCSVKKDTPEYRTFISWQSMIWRCTNENRKDYPRYGGRGISVCERWQKFENFLADMGLKQEGYSLGRIDNDGGYAPENVRWETGRQQARNRSSNRVVSYQGKELTLAGWAEITGIDRTTLAWRIKAGWPIEKVMSR